MLAYGSNDGCGENSILKHRASASALEESQAASPHSSTRVRMVARILLIWAIVLASANGDSI